MNETEINEINSLEEEISDIRKCLRAKEHALYLLKQLQGNKISDSHSNKLSKDDVSRYSRQMIMPEVGTNGQLALKKSSVLIVGAGGLGCPAALYLTGAGVGHIGLIDYDEVEVNNLHRQVLHIEANVGIPKVESAEEYLIRYNSNLQVTTYHTQLDSQNALNIIGKYDVVLDATDNVATRYLLSDACVLSERPLVSGSALKLEGQLTVYNFNGGPCYRCLFPSPPPPETVTNCGDGGVLGPVPGVIGTLQAMEAIKIISKMSGVLSQKLLVFDASDCTFQNFKIRNKSPECAVCGTNPTITELIDYEQFCGARANDKVRCLKLLSEEERVTASEFHRFQGETANFMLIDVRSPTEFQMCQLASSENVPIDSFSKKDHLDKLTETISSKCSDGVSPYPVFVVCRRGNDSQIAVTKLREALVGQDVTIKDIIGGLHAWAHDVDSDFPVY